MTGWEAVVGLEVHAQLKTRSKIFCACPTTFGAPPNTQVCPVCLGHPGALPVLNAGAVRLAVRAAVALGCEVAPESVFARKNYFYPDLPKGYQISQYDRPLATGGAVEIEREDGARRIGLVRVHLEEDAGKSVHDVLPGGRTGVDLNRAGVPLIEIVSEPEIGSAEEAYAFLQRLRAVLRWTGACDANLEEGSLRCDANVSVRRVGDPRLGTRTEIKNLNSFRNVERALEHEIARQIEVLEAGGTVEQRTAAWDAETGETRFLRGKEEAHDYRYFPDPDLPPLAVDRPLVEEEARLVPELPAARKRRFVEKLGIAPAQAHKLTLERPVADLFEEAARLSGNPRAVASFVLNDLPRAQNAGAKPPDETGTTPEALAELVVLVDRGAISTTAARTVFEKMFGSERSPLSLVRELGLEKVSDEETLRVEVRRVLDAHPAECARYREGKTRLLGFFVGKVMRATGGSADPGVVNALVREMLDA